MEYELEGDLDVRAFLGLAAGRPGFTEIRVTGRVAAATPRTNSWSSCANTSRTPPRYGTAWPTPSRSPPRSRSADRPCADDRRRRRHGDRVQYRIPSERLTGCGARSGRARWDGDSVPSRRWRAVSHSGSRAVTPPLLRSEAAGWRGCRGCGPGLPAEGLPPVRAVAPSGRWTGLADEHSGQLLPRSGPGQRETAGGDRLRRGQAVLALRQDRL
jgi:hypothetical protein